MVSINNDPSGHKCFTTNWFEGGSGCNRGTKKIIYFWRLFNEKEQSVRDALDLTRSVSRGQSKCNTCFKALGYRIWGNGRSFDDVFDDGDIWISYHWDTTTGIYGFTSGKEITVSQFAIDKGVRSVAATIVHELAHVNGASGPPSIAAEATLKDCGFADQFDPSTIGVNVHAPPRRVSIGPALLGRPDTGGAGHLRSKSALDLPPLLA
jgi:hypothetical protein